MPKTVSTTAVKPSGGESVGDRGGKMSVNSSPTLAISGQDLSRNGSSRAPWEEARANLKPSTPSRKPKPVSKHRSACGSPAEEPFQLEALQIGLMINQTIAK